MRILSNLPLVLALAAPVSASAPASGPSAATWRPLVQDEDQKFREKQAKELHKYAEYAFKQGFPQNAKRVWLMLLSEYDPDHAEARTALGYKKTSKSWALDPDFEYPREDNPDPRKAKALRTRWEKVAEKVAGNHKKEAEDYGKAGRADKERYHYEKVLFFQPQDEDAVAALEHKPVAGLTGTDLEQTLYERSKRIERAVAEQAGEDYDVKIVEGATHPLLEKAKVSYQTVQSEHFTVRGDFDIELLIKAALNAERALRVMQEAYKEYDGFNDDPARWLTDWSYFEDRETYFQILQANADLMDPKELEFRLEHTSSSNIVGNGTALSVGAAGNEQGILDAAVRSVARNYSGFRSAALNEGIGHTIVGMFFNNNRSFVVDRREQLRTSTKEEDIEKYSPNMDTWRDLAIEAAWKLSEGTPAARLPIITADKFPDDARIKAWSFCDYVVRRDPTLLRDLDQLRTENNPIDVEKKFTAKHDGLTLSQLEKEWKDFWTEASPVLKAIRDNTEPLTAVSKDVADWLEEFNDAREKYSADPVTWSASYSGRCKDHVEYLLAHEEERGPAAEQSQKIELEGGSHIGNLFAQMALVAIDYKKPKDVFERWIDYPGYRDALINNRLFTIGVYSQDDVVVFDAIRGVGRPEEGKGGYRIFPNGTRFSVPTQVKVEDLGPELKHALEKAGHGDKEVLGYPITLHHFGQGGVAGVRDSYQCKVKLRDEVIEGFVHVADGGSNRRTSAPGLIVFYPLEPLKKGSTYDVVWTFEHSSGTSRTEGKFNT